MPFCAWKENNVTIIEFYDKASIENIAGVLTELAEAYKDCIFDLTGG